MKYSFITEMIPENHPRLLFRRVLSLLITFYTSYLFFHFVVLNVFTMDNTLVIVVSIWAGHIFLNACTLGLTKSMTFGNFFVKIKYQGFRRKINQLYQIGMRSIFTTTLFYLVIFCNYLAGWSVFVLIASLLLAIGLNYIDITINHTTLSITDRITGTIALKKTKK